MDIYEGRGEHYLGYVRLGHIRADVHAKLDTYNDREIQGSRVYLTLPDLTLTNQYGMEEP